MKELGIIEKKIRETAEKKLTRKLKKLFPDMQHDHEFGGCHFKVSRLIELLSERTDGELRNGFSLGFVHKALQQAIFEAEIEKWVEDEIRGVLAWVEQDSNIELEKEQ